MQIQKVIEHTVNSDLSSKIADLLQRSFEGFPKGRIFFQQLPSFRIVVAENNTLIGHLAVHHRIISSNGVVFPIFGITDLCVAEMNQNSGIASSMLNYLEELAENSNIDFLMLVSGKNEFYLKRGFQLASNVCCWVMIQNNRSIGLVRRRVENGFMYRSIKDKVWPDGEIDLLGHVF